MSTTHLKDEENRGQTHPENDWWGVTANEVWQRLLGGSSIYKIQSPITDEFTTAI